MNPCFLRIESANQASAPDETLQLLKTRGISSYATSTLEGLPAALGGGVT